LNIKAFDFESKSILNERKW